MLVFRPERKNYDYFPKCSQPSRPYSFVQNFAQVLKLKIKKEYLVAYSLAFRVKLPNSSKKLNSFLPHFYLGFREGGDGVGIFGISFLDCG